MFGVCGGLAENLPDHICSAYFCVHMCLLRIFSMYLIIAFGDINIFQIQSESLLPSREDSVSELGKLL